MLPRIMLEANFSIQLPIILNYFRPTHRRRKKLKALKNFCAYIFNFIIWFLVCSVKWFCFWQKKERKEEKRYENYFTEERRVHINFNEGKIVAKTSKIHIFFFWSRCSMLIQNFKGCVFFSLWISCDVCDASTHN